LFKDDGWTRLVEAIQVGMKRRQGVTKPVDKKPSSGAKMATSEGGPQQIQPPSLTQDTQLEWVPLAIEQRIKSIGASIIKTTSGSKKEIEKAIILFRDWMLNGTIVRIIGAGRARLAGSIPANRLAHGGARVYIQKILRSLESRRKERKSFRITVTYSLVSIKTLSSPTRCKPWQTQESMSLASC
jgi:hypothetical protein